MKGKPNAMVFEAVFRAKLLDQIYNVWAESYVSSTIDWITQDWVSFQENLKFSIPESNPAFLIFEKAYPSGLEKHSLIHIAGKISEIRKLGTSHRGMNLKINFTISRQGSGIEPSMRD